jgi:hypothetical protein
MKINLKQVMGAVALSAMALGAIASPAFAVDRGQHLDKGPRWPHTYKVAGTGQKVTCPGPECKAATQYSKQPAGSVILLTYKRGKGLPMLHSS